MFFPSNYNEVIFMLLCTDVGNTNIKFALYKGEKLLMKLRFSTNRSKTADDYAVDLYTIFRINNVDVNEINGSIISSVVPIVTDLLGKAIFTVANVESLVVGPGIKTGLDIRLDNPGAVGSDIVCMCVALKEQCRFHLTHLPQNAHFCRRSVFLRRKRQSEQILPTVYAAA